MQIGSLYSIRQVTINLLEIPSGLIADALGRKTILVIGMILYIASFLAFFLLNGFVYFALAMVFYGIGEACRSGTHKAMILGYLKENNLLNYKTQFYGSTRSWSQFGSAISSLLAMIVFFVSQNYRLLFLVTAVPYVLNVINLLSYPDYLNHNGKSRHFVNNNTIYLIKETAHNFMNMLKNPVAIRSVFSAASYIAVYKTVKDYLQPLLKSLALGIPILTFLEWEQRSAVLIGLVYFLIFLMTSWTSRNAWRLEKKFSNSSTAINTAYLVGIISIIATGILVWQNILILAVCLFIGLYVIQNVRRPMMVSYLSENIDGNVMASGLSTESQLETILVAVTAPLLGYLIDSIGLGPSLSIVALLFLLAYPLIKLK